MKYADLIDNSFYIHRGDVSYIVSPSCKRVGLIKPLGNQLQREMERSVQNGPQKPRARPP